MQRSCYVRAALLITFVNLVAADIKNTTEYNATGDNVDIRRYVPPKKTERSTSSSSKSIESGERSSVSIGLTTHEESSSESRENKPGYPKSSLERTGWRKYHRKCNRCPADMVKKWRDPSIKWICGGYQRARRSFKSLCMMHYRNCQDGTMFIKIHDHRCANDTGTETLPHGDHFFYEYKVVLSDDKTDEALTSSSSGS